MQTGWIKNMLILIILGFFTNCETNLPVDNYLPVEKAPAEDFAGDIGGDYFVAPDGDDSNPGTIDEPWKTWTKAFKNAVAGDTVYFRGGVYYSTSDNGGERDFNSGTKEAPICFYNYPGETPILDCKNHDSSATGPGYNRAIAVWNTNYIYFKGLHVRNVYQKLNSDVEGISIYKSGNIIFENMVAYNIEGVGFTAGAYFNTIQYINCDAYDLCDPLRTNLPPLPSTPGQNGVGFQFNNQDKDNGEASEIYYIGCRTWNFSDNGFAGISIGYAEFENCWAFDGGQLYGEGCGFKYSSVFGGVNTLPLARTLKNCIGAMNGGYGFSPNNQGAINMAVHAYNNSAYHNGYKDETLLGDGGLGYGFRIMQTNPSNATEQELYANNLAFDNEGEDLHVVRNMPFVNRNNSWNLGLTVTDKDFISLDWTELKKPRKADGSLPDIDFMKQKDGSQLIDKGVNVGLPFKGIAPDLGAFEKN